VSLVFYVRKSSVFITFLTYEDVIGDELSGC